MNANYVMILLLIEGKMGHSLPHSRQYPKMDENGCAMNRHALHTYITKGERED